MGRQPLSAGTRSLRLLLPGGFQQRVQHVVRAVGLGVEVAHVFRRDDARHALARGDFDANTDEIEAVLRNVYGASTALWMRRWRWFFLATSGLCGYADGSEWGVSHYRMKAV